MKLALLALLISSCSGSPSTVPIQWIRATPEQVEQWCGKGANGCYKVFGGVCMAIAPDPSVRVENGKRLFSLGQWGTLGHEVKHCFDGEFHD